MSNVKYGKFSVLASGATTDVFFTEGKALTDLRPGQLVSPDKDGNFQASGKGELFVALEFVTYTARKGILAGDTVVATELHQNKAFNLILDANLAVEQGYELYATAAGYVTNIKPEKEAVLVGYAAEPMVSSAEPKQIAVRPTIG